MSKFGLQITYTLVLVECLPYASCDHSFSPESYTCLRKDASSLGQ